MATIFEIEKIALDLPERERAKLAMNLLESLPPVLSDQHEESRKRSDAMRRWMPIQAKQLLSLSWILTFRTGANEFAPRTIENSPAIYRWDQANESQSVPRAVGRGIN